MPLIPRVASRVVAVLSNWLPPILLIIAGILMAIVSTTPKPDQSLYLFQIELDLSSSLLNSGVDDVVRFGVWGFCSSGLEASLFGIAHDQLTAAGCGAWSQLNSPIFTALRLDKLIGSISGTLAGALVLHIVGAVLSFTALVFYLGIVLLDILKRPLGGKVGSFLDFLFVVLTGAAFGTTMASFILDVVFVSFTGTLEETGLIESSSGNGTWFALAAAILLLVAVIFAYLWNRRRKKERKRTGPEMRFDGNRFVLVSSESKDPPPASKEKELPPVSKDKNPPPTTPNTARAVTNSNEGPEPK